MDAENDNDQPNSSSASASSSSSNNSSSSNLLGHLPMLPFMRSTDDDEQEADGEEVDGNDNDPNEEPMPLQPPLTVAMATATAAAQPASASEQQPTLAPIIITATTSANATATSTAAASASSSVGREEPMVGAEQLAVMTSSSASSLPPSSSYASSASLSSSTALSHSFVPLPSSAFLPSANPSQVIFSSYSFNNPLPPTDFDNEITPPSPAPLFPERALQVDSFNTSINDNNMTPLITSSPSSSTASSSLSSQSSHHEIQSNLASSPQQSLSHEQNPIPNSLFSISSQQQQHQISPPPPTTTTIPQAQPTTQLQSASNIESTLSASTSSSVALQQQLAAGLSQQDQGHQLTAQINRSDIADTIDASAVIVQPLEAIGEHQQHPHLYPQEAAGSDEVGSQQHQHDIQLDDNDNNDFDVDLNLRNDDALVNATISNHQQTQPQETPQPSISLDNTASGSSGPSSSRQQQQTPQPPTTLPLLLQQQQQPQQLAEDEQEQQTEESKHLPSYDHHYHNPSDYHLNSNSYQNSCGLPYGYRVSELAQDQHTNGALNNTNNNIFNNTMSSDRNHGPTSGLGGIPSRANNAPVVDRLKLLYPNVNENETPLPRCWSAHDKCLSIGLSQNNLRVHFKGVGKQSNDAASVRTAHPIPPACGIYYFEVKIISKGKNGYMGIGLTAQQFRMNRLPGWDKQSYGYHGDDGNSFSSSGHGQSYGPTFTTGDIIGCCVNFVNNTCFYTKNGVDLGIAFRELPTKLYPTVGLQTPGEEVDANFGQEPFKFEQIEDMMKQMWGEIKTSIYDFPLPAEQGDPTTLLQKMVSSYLVHNGYSQTAEAFGRQKSGISQREDMSSIRNRQKVLKLVMSGKMGQAIEQTMRLYPGLLENNKNLWFLLKCRQFIEMINGSDVEYCPSPFPSSTTNANKTTNSITTQTSAPNQTSVIQSTKSYQNGNGSNNSSNGSAAATTDATATTTVTTVTSTTNSNSNTTNAVPTVTATTNNAQNSSHLAVINTDNDIKTQSNLAEHCTTSNDVPVTISKSNSDNDYLNDVEMENNGHTNGNVCKNGNTNIFNDIIEADIDMEIDVAPSVRKYSHGIERILDFGKDLSQMGQQLEKENKMTDEERQMLEDAFSLIAYSNPWASPLGWQLCPTKRETVCRALNSAILESMNYPKWSPLEYCVAHANELIKVMAQASLGACAFVNIADVFPKN